MPKTEEQATVICKPFGNRCNICGAFFAEGDDVCGAGGHQIGERYQIPISPPDSPE